MQQQSACGTLLPLALFWGHNTPPFPVELALIAPCVFALVELGLRTVLFVKAERPKRPFSIGEVLLYHQREIWQTRKRYPDQISGGVERAAAARAAADRATRTNAPVEVRAHAQAVAMQAAAVHIDVLNDLPPPDHRQRRRTQKLLKLLDALVLCAWIFCFFVRRPLGLMICVLAAAISLIGVTCTHLAPEGETAQRALLRTAVHHACAATAFAACAGALLLSHGYCGWPALPFVLCMLVAGGGRLVAHIPFVQQRPQRLGAGVRLVAVLCEWAAVLLLHLALMLPPAYDEHDTSW